jgi:uncharacterized NAD(P)/FAD-binding protein YdhS
MPNSEVPYGHAPVIAVVGGGASGTLAVVHLLRLARAESARIRILLIDEHGRHGRGRAYATTHPGHLLNSPAEGMSAVARDPGHLTRWAAGAGLDHDGFLTRRDYGRYLSDLLADAERAAQPGSRVTRITTTVTAISSSGPGRPLRLRLAAGDPVDADAVVLATGSLPPATARPMPASDRYIGDPWAPGALTAPSDGRPVLVIGTGLTMLDIAMAVTDADPRTVVHAVSRHALLPRQHRRPRPAARTPLLAAPVLAGPALVGPALGIPESAAPVLPDLVYAAGPLRLARLVREVRAAARQHPGDWQDLVDALRPHVPGLWGRLSPADQRLFLRRYARYWEIHRHRVPPATARHVARLRAEGRLCLLHGQVIAAWDEPDGIRARIASQGSVTDLSAGWLINGTGPATDITRVADPLLRSLLDTGLARPDPHRLGLDASSDNTVLDASGRPGDRIFVLGPLLRGRRYETTAIPEIRDQAAVLARRLITLTSAADRRGSAA